MEERMVAENELNGIKREAETLAEALENDGGDLDTDQVADMIRMLVKGSTAAHIINHFEIESGA